MNYDSIICRAAVLVAEYSGLQACCSSWLYDGAASIVPRQISKNIVIKTAAEHLLPVATKTTSNNEIWHWAIGPLGLLSLACVHYQY